MRLWMMLPTRFQQYFANKVMQYGMRNGNERLTIWGATHFPIVIEGDLDDLS